MVNAMSSLSSARRSFRYFHAVRDEDGSVRSRAWAMALVIVLHVAVLVALVVWEAVPVARRPTPPLPITLTLPDAANDEAGSPAPKAPKAADAPPPMPVLPEALPIPSSVPPPLVKAEPVDWTALTPQFDAEPDPTLTGDVTGPASPGEVGKGAGGAGDCPLAAILSQALERNVKARTALARIPAQSRSVANAVLLWNGEWISAERVGGASALYEIQDAIAEAIAGAPSRCRTQVEPGPVFLIVNGAPETIVLALGSGTWRWMDLIADTSARIGMEPENKR